MSQFQTLNDWKEQPTQTLPVTTRQFSRPGVLSRKKTMRVNIVEFLSIAFLVGSICVALAMVSLLPLPNAFDKLINPTPTQIPCAKVILLQSGDGTFSTVLDKNCP
jgi:hypothetical protein